ncbi:MAG: flavin reductase [Clostridia bacterium]|nr:flavin reductase [Clostridia bacterium]
MFIKRQISEDLYYVGANDRRIALFENVYPVENGVSYNSYFLDDEKTCLIDTVDKSCEKQLKENLKAVLAGRNLDYVVVDHMEPDHSATLAEIISDHPGATVVCNAKISAMLENYFGTTFNTLIVKEGDKLPLGKHTLTFIDTPMVHWPEVMMTYDEYGKTLFSADAFGSFGAISGNFFADEITDNYVDEMRRYYTNIVGKYGVQVQSTLKKASALEINTICSLHGLIWRKNVNLLLEKYSLWSSYKPETEGVLIVYASVYGNTENAAEILAAELDCAGVKHVAVYDVSKTDHSYLIAEAFRYSHVVFASTTYNAGVFVKMENFVNDLTAHGIANRTFAVIENGSWAATAGKLIKDKLSTLNNCEFLGEQIKITSSVKAETALKIKELAEVIAASLTAIGHAETAYVESEKIDKTAFFKMSYGLYAITTYDGKHNACIVNTVIQLTDSPKRIAVAVNRANYTCETIIKTKKFNACALSESATFDTFKRFGFQSGRDTDKFDGFDEVATSANGLYILTGACAYFSAKVVGIHEYGTHVLFIAEVEEAKTLSEEKPMTYEYYFANVKPKPVAVEEKKKGYVCKICGYVYEGDELPEDFICPLCKHGVDDFEKIK